MASATPTPAAAGPSAVPGPEPSSGQLLKMLVGSLSRLVHPSLASEILKAAASEAGIDIKDVLPAPLPAATKGPKAPRANAKKETKRSGRAFMPYLIFVSKVMERLKDDPEYQTHRPAGSNGKPETAMALAGRMWKQLKDETRETFSKSYQPLCDTLTSERAESGVKTEGLMAKIHAFESGFDPAVKNQLKDILPASMSSILSAAAAALPALPEGAHEEESEDSEDSDDDDEEENPAATAAEAAAKRVAEEQRLEAEKKAKEEEAKQKKKEERDAKKKEKKLTASAVKAPAVPGAPGAQAAAAAPAAGVAAGTEDKKGKKKHKGKEQGDQPGSAKKAKKDKA